MKRLKLTDYLALALATAAVATASLYSKSLLAEGDSADDASGRIVDIGEGDLDDLPVVEGEVPESAEETIAEGPARLWIGIAGRPVASPVLRTHLQLADDLGVVIDQVVPDSPAAKAGLRKHDVLIGVNGEPVTDLSVVQQMVVDSDGEPIELKVIRLAKETVIEVAPQPMPAEMARQAAQMQQRNPLGMNGPRGLMEQLQQLEGLEGFDEDLLRRLQRAPQIIGNGAPGNVPNGVSVSISREGDGPAQVTVRRGDESWTVVADDEQSLNELPEELRPMVRRMLRMGGGEGRQFEDFNWQGQLEQLLPNHLGQFEFGGLEERMQQQGEAAAGQARRAARQLRQQAEQLQGSAGDASDQLIERMEQLEQKLEQLQQRLHQETPQPSQESADN